jgi:hypothetical protein
MIRLQRVYTFILFMLSACIVSTVLYGFSYEECVVQIRVTIQEYDYYSPWQRKRHSVSSLHGCVIQKNPGLIATLSLPLENHVYIEVSKYGKKRRYPAKVVLKDYKTGLALLTAENQLFFQDLDPVRLSDEPMKPGKGIVVKWDSSGRFKQYSTEAYEHSIQSYEGVGGALIHQMTTGLDAGGDGEPVFQDDILIGLNAWFDRDKKIIKVNSADTLKWMLQDYRNGSYNGQAFFWLEYNGLNEDENLKNYLGLNEGDTGIFVTDIPPTSSGYGVLKKGDVILSIDGHSIDDNGFCTFPHYGKLNYKWIIYNHYVGETVVMEIVRQKERKQVEFILLPATEDSVLIPSHYTDKAPTYYITGGFVFQELTRGFLNIWGGDWEKKADKRLVFLTNKYWSYPSESKRRVVILNRVLPAASNTGYHEKSTLILESINKQEVRDLEHVRKLVEESSDTYIVFRFSGNECIVVQKKKCIESTKAILLQYEIPVQHNLKF